MISCILYRNIFALQTKNIIQYNHSIMIAPWLNPENCMTYCTVYAVHMKCVKSTFIYVL